MKWIGLMLMVLAALGYWVSRINDLDSIFTNISIIFLALGALIMASGLFFGKRAK